MHFSKKIAENFLELSPMALGFTYCALAPIIHYSTDRTDNNVVSYTPVNRTNQPSRPPNQPKIAFGNFHIQISLQLPYPRFSYKV